MRRGPVGSYVRSTCKSIWIDINQTVNCIVTLEGIVKMIDVKEEEDGSFTISWDENDPVESMLNDFTEQDFVDAIMAKVREVLETEQDDV